MNNEIIRPFPEIVTENTSEKTALIDKKRSMTYRQLGAAVKAYAAFLAGEGVKKGDRVILTAFSECAYVAVFMAVQALGAVTVPVERAVREDTLTHLVQLSGAKLLLTAGKKKYPFVKTISVSEIPADTDADYPHVQLSADMVCEFVVTSGTTGMPKCAYHTNRNIFANTVNTCEGVGIRKDDVILIPLPLNHSFGLRVLRSALCMGATAVLQNGTLFPKEIKNNIEKYSCTGLAYISSAMESILATEGEQFVREVFGKLRFIEFSAGAVPVNIRKQLTQLLPGVDIHNTWGSSETGGSIFINLSRTPAKVEALGRPRDDSQAGIYDEKTGSMLTGTGRENTGRLALRGDMVMQGYWNDTEKTNAAFNDGWLLTNDIVWRDDDGYYYMIGRGDDIINLAGEKIAPQEVEAAANQLPYIYDSACLAVKDASHSLGMKLVLLARGDETKGEEALKALRSTLNRLKAPEEIKFVANIPRNSMGKINRKELPSLWGSGSSGGSAENAVINTIMTRRSIRNFTDVQVPEDMIKVIVEAGRYAPSGRNSQTRQFTVIRSVKEIEHLRSVTGAVAGREKTSFNGFNPCSTLILISNERRNKDGIQDAACAAENIMLAAASMSLGSVWLNPLMNISDQPEIREILDSYGIPKGHIVWAVIPVGYPDSTPVPVISKENVVRYID